MGKRLKWLLALPVLALAVLAFVGTAAAGTTGGETVPINTLNTADDPQTANIPYLAWAGNQDRIAKCFTREQANGDVSSELINPFKVGKFVVEDWSGYELTGGGSDGSVNRASARLTRSS